MEKKCKTKEMFLFLKVHKKFVLNQNNRKNIEV
jgi:hypothetical protein